MPDLPESRRTVVVAATPDGDKCSLVVLRLGHGRGAFVALSHHGTRECTALLSAADVTALLEAVGRAALLTADQRHALAKALSAPL